ncbi:MAG: pseudouridine synthase [Flavobacteriales bacterium]|nr:pseudouridine synthase [Flavobacteriales bacterium]
MRDQGKKPFGKKNRDDSAAGRGSKETPFKAFRAKPTEEDKRPERPERPSTGRFAPRPTSGKAPLGGKGKKRPEGEEKKSTLPRLNQYVAKAGVCSRREADELISTGKIKVNGKIVREMGLRVQLDDKVEFEGKVLQGEELRYVLLNKPKGFISNVTDEKGRRTVMDLVKKACKERIYPVGRLERDSTGLLLFTNDGDLAKKLTNPTTKVKQIYHVFLDKPMEGKDIDTMMAGVTLEEFGMVKPDVVNYVQEVEDGTQLGAQFHSGRNTFVRPLFEHFGYGVIKLDRALLANLTKKDLPRGKWRFLKDKEISMLKVIAGKGKAEPSEEKTKDEVKSFPASKATKPKFAKPTSSAKPKSSIKPKTSDKPKSPAKPKSSVKPKR